MSTRFINPAALIVTINTCAAEVAHPRKIAGHLNELFLMLLNDLNPRKLLCLNTQKILCLTKVE